LSVARDGVLLQVRASPPRSTRYRLYRRNRAIDVRSRDQINQLATG
jgi:hypothetical protein